MPNITVAKFGGSSQCERGLQVILQKTREYLAKGESLIFVISAVGKTTNNLYQIVNSNNYSVYQTIYDEHLNLCTKLKIDSGHVRIKLQELKFLVEKFQSISETLKDYVDDITGTTVNLKLSIISFGEILSSLIVYLYLKTHCEVEYYDVKKLIKNINSSKSIDIQTLNIKGEFYCTDLEIKTLVDKIIKKPNVPIVTQGFIAGTQDDRVCILTRSGSNTSASLIANSVNAVRLEIWTDVSGLYTCDPRKVPSAKVIESVSYSVCQEAAAMGSQIIHPFSLKPCEEKSIPIHIKNTFKPDDVGTIITKTDDLKDLVHLISAQTGVSIFEITSMDMWEGYGFVYDIFKSFNEEKIDVNIITTSQFTISTTTNEKSQVKIDNLLKKLREKYTVKIITDCTIVSIVANDVKNNEQLHKIHSFVSLEEPVHMIHYGANNLTLSYVVNELYGVKLMETFHTVLIE